MLIIVGKKTSRKLAGFFIDHCELCHVPQVHRVDDVYEVEHLYYIPYGKPGFVGRERVCETCETARSSAMKVYLPLIPGRADHQQMLEAIPAGIRGEWTEAMAQEEAITRDPSGLTGEARRLRMLELFRRAETRARKALGENPTWEPRMGRMLLLWLGICLPLWVFTVWFTKLDAVVRYEQELVGELYYTSPIGCFVVGLVVGGVLALYYLRTREGVYLKTQVEPSMATALAQMTPTRPELSDMIAWMQTKEFIVAKLDVQRLLALVARARRG